MKKRKNSLFPFLSFLLSCVFLFSAGMIVQELVIREREKTAFASLSALVADTKDLRFKETSDLPTASFNDPASPGAETEHNSLGSETMPKAVQKNVLPQYAQLYEMNPDFFGWITIDETNINYPVMYTPDRPEYYLHRAFDGSSSNSGVPFVEENCPPDGNYYLIYGHHMKNGTMFEQIAAMDKQETFDQINTVWYVTEQGATRLEPLLMYYVRADDQTVRQFDFPTTEEFRGYLDGLLSKAVTKRADADKVITGTDHVFSLVTCNYYKEYYLPDGTNGRSVLVCVPKDEADKALASAS